MGYRVNFVFHPANAVTRAILPKEGGSWGIERDEGDGKKGRYLAGISSGVAPDAYKDNMTEECIRSFARQFESKDIPLYVNHGKDFTDDVGVMTRSEIQPNGDWMTEYRLHDGDEKADKVWKQINGLPPYAKPKQFGFSIEGNIPDGAMQKNAHGGNAIREINLDPGVALVTRPAYTTSQATAIQKAIRHGDFEAKNDLISERIKRTEAAGNFHNERWKIEDAMQHELKAMLEDKTMQPEEKEAKATGIFDSYKTNMAALLKSMGYAFSDDADEEPTVTDGEDSKTTRIDDEMGKLSKILKEKDMDENLKTVLSDVISSLEMLLGSSTEVAPEQPGTEAAMSKSIARKHLAKAKQLIREAEAEKEPEKADDLAAKAMIEIRLVRAAIDEDGQSTVAAHEKPKDPMEQTQGPVAKARMASKLFREAEAEKDPEMKALKMAMAQKLARNEAPLDENGGNASQNAEDIINQVYDTEPETGTGPAAKAARRRIIAREIQQEAAALQGDARLVRIERALETFITGFGLDTVIPDESNPANHVGGHIERSDRGLQGNLGGGSDLIGQLADEVIARANKQGGGASGAPQNSQQASDELRRNAGTFASYITRR